MITIIKEKMKDKIITLKVDGAAQGQWSSLLLELNLIKQAWKSYGVDITIKAPGLKNVLNHGTKIHDFHKFAPKYLKNKK
jgi:hypothetical protein